MRPAGPAPTTAMRSPCGGAAAEEPGLPAGGAVDDAAQLRAAAHLVDAGVAGEAAPRRLAAGELCHPVRLRDQGAPERDEIRLAGGDRVGGDIGIAEPADGDDGHGNVLLDLRRIGEKRRVGIDHRRDHAGGRGQRAVVPGGDVKRVGARLRRPQRDLPAFGKRRSLREKVFHRHAVDHGDAHGGFHRAQHLEPEPRPVLEAAAIGVGAPVLERGDELRDQVAVRGMDFDAIEAGLLGARRGRSEAGDGERDVLGRHLLRDDGLVGDLEHRMRDRRRRQRRLPADIEAGVAAAVAELDRGLCPAGSDRGGEPRQARQEAVVIDAELAPAVAARLGGRGHLHGDEADAAAHPGHVVVHGVVGDVAVLRRTAASSSAA